MALEDSQSTRMIQRQLNRRYVDSTRVDVRVMHGVCYVRGYLLRLRNHPEVDMLAEAETIRKIIRQSPGIREVIWEVETIH